MPSGLSLFDSPSTNLVNISKADFDIWENQVKDISEYEIIESYLKIGKLTEKFESVAWRLRAMLLYHLKKRKECDAEKWNIALEKFGIDNRTAQQDRQIYRRFFSEEAVYNCPKNYEGNYRNEKEDDSKINAGDIEECYSILESKVFFIHCLPSEFRHGILYDFAKLKSENQNFSTRNACDIAQKIINRNGNKSKRSNIVQYKNFWVKKSESRRGQEKFRRSLLSMYKECPISGCKVDDVLEAAHIEPYTENKNMEIWNGIILRSDLHTLFDLCLMSINPIDFKVHFRDNLKQSKEYGQFHNRSLSFFELSKEDGEKRRNALEMRWKIFEERTSGF